MMPGTQQSVSWRQLALLLLAIPVVIAAAILGLFFLLALAGLAVLTFAGIWLRLWWLKRKLGRQPSQGAIEGEYVVVRETRYRERDRLP